jgi:hypothetical protein
MNKSRWLAAAVFALIVGALSSSPALHAQFGDVSRALSDANKQMADQFAAFGAAMDEAARAAYAAGSFTDTIKSISVSSTGGYACEGGTFKSVAGRGFLVTASNGRKAIFTAASEDVLKRTLAAAMAAQLAGLNVAFTAANTDCANVANAIELTITK